MNINSIYIFKAVCFAFITLAIVFGLTSCALVPSKAPGIPDVSAAPSETGTVAPSASADASPSPATTPSAPLTDKQIRDAYDVNGLSVLEIRDAGEYTMVHYYSLEVPNDKISRFDWFDRKTGERELVYGWVYADKFEITADKSLTVLTTGVHPSDGMQSFPKIFTSCYTEQDGAVEFYSTEQEYYMPLEQHFTVGSDRPECLKRVCFDSGSMLLTFSERPGYEAEFHGAAETVPKISVINQDGVSTVTIYNTILSDNFVQTAGRMLGSAPSPLTVICDGTDTVITFKLYASAGRYNIRSFNTPVEHIPHAVITYGTSEFGYPKGW